VSSDVTKRQSAHRRAAERDLALSDLRELALNEPEEKEEGSSAEDEKGEKEHGRTHSMHLIVAVLAILIMIALVVLAFQVDCFGQKKPRQASHYVDDANRSEARTDADAGTGRDEESPGCCSWLTKQVNKVYNTCCIRKRQESGDVQEVRHTKQSANFLFIASILLFFAFLMVGLLCLIDYAFTTKKNFLGDPFPSGHNYFPQHIGDLLRSEGSARGTIFFALTFTAGSALLASWYPYRLRNCDVGDHAIMFMGISWNTFRHLGVTIALWILALVPTSRLAVAGYGGTWGEVTVYIHLLAFLIFCGGYIICELHALHSRDLSSQIGKKEWKVRAIFIGLCTFCFLAFELVGFIDGLANTAGACCDDVWIKPNGDHMKQAMAADHLPAVFREVGADAEKAKYLTLMDSRVLYNTASGLLLGLKVTQFVLQVYALLFLSLSQLAIWFFSKASVTAPPATWTGSQPIAAEEPVVYQQEADVQGEVPETSASLAPRHQPTPTLPIFKQLPPRGTQTNTATNLQPQPAGQTFGNTIVYERIPATSEDVYVQEEPVYSQETWAPRPMSAPTNVM
jgi:hypothetical protein